FPRPGPGRVPIGLDARCPACGPRLHPAPTPGVALMPDRARSPPPPPPPRRRRRPGLAAGPLPVARPPAPPALLSPRPPAPPRRPARHHRLPAPRPAGQPARRPRGGRLARVDRGPGAGRARAAGQLVRAGAAAVLAPPAAALVAAAGRLAAAGPGDGRPRRPP